MIDNIATQAFSAGQAQMMADMAQMRVQASGGRIAPAAEMPSAASLPGPSFGAVMEQAIRHVDNLQNVAADKQRAVDMGISDDLTGAMLESQKASVAFSAMMQVRNKLVGAFDEVMNIAL